MKTCNRKILGLFPYFGPKEIGGVQASARIAWAAVAQESNGDATLFTYAEKNIVERGWTTPQTLVVCSKLEAIRNAISRTWDPDLVFIWHLGLIKLLPFFRLSNVRVVQVLLGIESWKNCDWFTQKQLDRVDLFLTISDHTWHAFLKNNSRYAMKPHQTIRLGIGSPIDRTVRQPQRPPVALMVGRLLRSESYKGHRQVIEAWPDVLRRCSEAQLWIAGDGDLRVDLERTVAQLNLSASVRFLGQVSEDRKEELIEKCHCLLMPSLAEGFGLVYLEAMRLGRPCLVGSGDAGKEVVNPPEAGLAADPDQREVLTEAICSLIAEGSRWQQWSIQARRRYETNYTASHFQERLLAALSITDCKPDEVGQT